ncbi:MAPEG family protein [Pseudomonas sp. NPDC090755]|uniref:MAPEG family protein n=1 Tax=Pseudomonas sp. NPDC090755 TaxID=3364481 RepID=UPI00383B5095
MSNALPVYALCVVVLFLKMFALSCYQGYFRLRFVAFTNQEDAAVFNRPARDAERPEVIRASRAWANDLENIPVFFVLCALAIALETPATLSAWLSILFTLARVLHTLAYLAGVQPWRTVFYGIGILCLLGFCAILTLRVVTS